MRRWEACGSSHIGGRDENQDAWLVEHDTSAGEVLAVVADGMGGHKGGARASQMVIEAARDVWSRREGGRALTDLLEEIVARAHERLRRSNIDNEADAQSTLAALWLRGGDAASVHVGDSRVMQFRDDQLVERTLDHSMAQLHVLRGRIREEDLATHPDQAKLITSIGGDEAPQAEYCEWSLIRGDRFVLCSDGFWEIVSSDRQAALLAHPQPATALEAEIHACLEQADDDHDNVTAILIRPASNSAGTAWRRPAAIVVAAVALLAAVALAAHIFLVPSPPAAEDTAAGAAAEPKADGGGKQEPADAEVDAKPTDEESAPDQDAAPAKDKHDADSGDTVTQSDDEAAPVADAGEDPDQVGEGKLLAAEAGELEPLSRDVRIDYPDPDAGDAALLEWLHEAGLLEPGEALTRRRHSDLDNGAETITFKVYHDGLPVLGSSINIRVRDGEIVRIQGEVPVDINLPASPVLEFAEAVTEAARQADLALEPRGSGTLFVYRSDPATNTYTRVWRGITMQEHYILIDAHTGALLQRWSAATEHPT